MPRKAGSKHESYKNAGCKKKDLDEDKVKEVQSMISEGHKLKTIVERTGLSRFLVNRIKNSITN